MKYEVIDNYDGYDESGKEYPLESRSYEFRSDEKYFLSGTGGSSIFATSMDKSDVDVRLDLYLNKWKVDYCYLR